MADVPPNRAAIRSNLNRPTKSQLIAPIITNVNAVLFIVTPPFQASMRNEAVIHDKGVYGVQVHIINQMLSVTVGHSQGNITAWQFFSEKMYLPYRFTERLFSKERVSSQGNIVASSDLLKAGQKLWIQGAYDSDQFLLSNEINLSDPLRACSILYEDEHILVVDKPANLIVHTDGKEETDCLDNRVAAYYANKNQRGSTFHVHRLDKGTTGALIYSKHGFMVRALDEELRRNQIKRTYLALTYGRGLSSQGIIDWAIGRDRHVNGKYRVSPTGKGAVTIYKRLLQHPGIDGVFSLIACRLQTGRTHQIRVHLSALGAPIVGDVLYRGKQIDSFNEPANGIGLHAGHVQLFHPYEEADLNIEAPLPKTWHCLFKQFGWLKPNVGKIFTMNE